MNEAPPYILLVEDDPLDAELATLAFDLAGYATSLVVTEDGQDALDFLRREGHHAPRPARLPALILLDLNMRRMNGFEVMKALRADPALRVIPVIVLTTSKSAADRTRCLELGATDYLHKPDHIDAFERLVHDLCHTWLT